MYKIAFKLQPQNWILLVSHIYEPNTRDYISWYAYWLHFHHPRARMLAQYFAVAAWCCSIRLHLSYPSCCVRGACIIYPAYNITHIKEAWQYARLLFNGWKCFLALNMIVECTRVFHIYHTIHTALHILLTYSFFTVHCYICECGVYLALYTIFAEWRGNEN